MKILKQLNFANALCALLLSGVLIITSHSCKKANGVSAELLKTLSSKKSEEFGFGMSMASSTWNDTLPNEIIHYLLIQDSNLLDLCRKVDVNDIAEDLLICLEDPDLAWQANMVLYRLTYSDALGMHIYRPNRVEEWKKEKWADHKRMWRKMFTESR